MRKTSPHAKGALLLLVTTLFLAVPPAAAASPTDTPAEMVATYSSLADGILALKQTEHNMVLAILAGAYNHAQGIVASLEAAGGKDLDKSKIEALAALVAQLGNEGDASVAAIRKRLLDGGHHHHSNDGDDGMYDEGFVIVTKKAKQAFLGASQAIAKMAGSSDMKALKEQWKIVSSTYSSLVGS